MSIEIPPLGFGTWKVDDAGTERAVTEALAAGYRHIDTAALYANEHGVGRALGASGLARSEVFVTSKVWNDRHGRDETVAAFDETCERLGSAPDLYLIHWPCPATDRYVETWATLRELRDAGRVRWIGVSNFEPHHLQRLFDVTGEWPTVNQVELHPWLPQGALRAFHAEHGIRTEAWAPLARGRIVDTPLLADLAAKHAAALDRPVTAAQVVIAWHLAIGNVVIPKSVTPARIAENLAARDLHLDQADLAAIATLETGERTGKHPDEVN